MDRKEKIQKIAKLMDCEEELLEDTVLENLDEWDSLSQLSLVVMLNEEFGREMTGAQIRELVTVGDILKLME